MIADCNSCKHLHDCDERLIGCSDYKDENMNSLGELLAKIRMGLAVTQEGLAMLCRINVGRIDSFEKDQLIPKRKELHSIIKGLNLDKFDSDNLFDWRNKILSRRHSA